MLSSLEESEMSSKSLIACMSWSRSLIAVLPGPPFSILHKPDLPEPLLLRSAVCWLNVFLARFSEVALRGVMVTNAM
eukprot:15300138-Ditylum_brightwellii.AAC.1